MEKNSTFIFLYDNIESYEDLIDADEMFEGTVDRNRIPAKDKFMPIPLPATRPSFPVNIGQGALLKSEGNGAADVTGGGSVTLCDLIMTLFCNHYNSKPNATKSYYCDHEN